MYEETNHTYFARVEPNEVVQLVNETQLDYTKQLKADGELEEDLPILSAEASFRAGRDGEYTYISESKISIGEMRMIALETTTENRQIIIDYVINHEGPLDLEVSQNWTMAPFEPTGNVIFSSSANAVDYYEEYERIELHDEDGNAAYFLYE